MTLTAKLGRKSQIVIPKQARESLGLTEGDELIIDVVEDRIIIKQRPASYSKKLKGLHKKIWKGVDADKYVRKERELW
ncbi:MAG TPA: AbrB/MazE/SpoVT family DNA-binding domain-containing protein [Nitrospirae bacterium]|nr:AbrB/MazE/SpoVT family DNA-binding domain-containing protein [Nitrospirota bacterium]